ncbi:unnamed protein product [Caenorhabditis nigoni]
MLEGSTPASGRSTTATGGALTPTSRGPMATYGASEDDSGPSTRTSGASGWLGSYESKWGTASGQANGSASTFPHQCHFWSINANVDNIYVDVGWIWRFIAILNKVEC